MNILLYINYWFFAEVYSKLSLGQIMFVYVVSAETVYNII